MNSSTASASRLMVSVVVLAGGTSSRLGRDKALLPIDGQPLLARTVLRLAPLSDDLIVVTNEAESHGSLGLPVRLVPDERPGEGSLMGVYSGLKAARHEQALVAACDMPFLSLPLIRYMLGVSEGYEVVIPRLNALLEPLHAIYSKSCLAPISRVLDKGQRRIVGFFSEVRVRYVEKGEIDAYDPHHLSFLNVNNSDDWERARTLLKEGGPLALAADGEG